MFFPTGRWLYCIVFFPTGSRLQVFSRRGTASKFFPDGARHENLFFPTGPCVAMFFPDGALQVKIVFPTAPCLAVGFPDGPLLALFFPDGPLRRQLTRPWPLHWEGWLPPRAPGLHGFFPTGSRLQVFSRRGTASKFFPDGAKHENVFFPTGPCVAMFFPTVPCKPK